MRPILKLGMFKGMNTSNWTLDQLVKSIKRCEMLKKSFEVSFGTNESSHYELDTIPLSALSFTKTPDRSPMLNFQANFGSSFSSEGPPINKPKDKFGFDF